MNNTWKKVFILLSAYLSAIAFAVIGGVVWYKDKEDEEIRKTLKLALIVTLIFTGIFALLNIFNYIGGLASNYYSSAAYEFYSIMNKLVNIAEIVTFTVLIVKALIDKSENKEVAVKQQNLQIEDVNQVGTNSSTKENNIQSDNSVKDEKSDN